MKPGISRGPYLEDGLPVKVFVVNNHGDRKSPIWGYSPSKWPKWLINEGYYLLTNWDDPPSGGLQRSHSFKMRP